MSQHSGATEGPVEWECVVGAVETAGVWGQVMGPPAQKKQLNTAQHLRFLNERMGIKTI